MISVENIIHNNDGLMTIVFNKKVLAHLKCKSGENIIVIQSLFKRNLFMITKCTTGHKIKAMKNNRNYYQVFVKHKFDYMTEFPLKECSYFLKNNNSIRFIINN